METGEKAAVASGTATGRRLILCFDGTNNKYQAVNTNVVKLYAMLDRAADQFTYYQPGIGTFTPPGIFGKLKRVVIKRLDLAIAWLLEDHVCDGYRFLMRYYKEGDQIFIFGFSRGAYTARALAAMLNKVGLLTAGNEELIPFAWQIFKKDEDHITYTGFKETFSRPIRVRFLGVWDTVNSTGWAWHPKHLPYTANNPIVDIVRHAVSLDERRAYYIQNLWTHTPPPAQDVLQVWFPGVHCDVGGGYPEAEAGLSKIALHWMVREAKRFGLRFVSDMEKLIIPTQSTAMYSAPDPTATLHQSLQGFWWLLEYIPKSYKDPRQEYATWWEFHRGRPRYVAEGSNIHLSVIERKQKVPSYEPSNLPQLYYTVS